MKISDSLKRTLRRMLRYDAKTGILTWTAESDQAGSSVINGTVSDDATVTVGDTDLSVTSVAWFLKTDIWPEYGVAIVDPTNPDPLRKSNLKKIGRTTWVNKTFVTVEKSVLKEMISLVDASRTKKVFYMCQNDCFDIEKVELENKLFDMLKEMLK